MYVCMYMHMYTSMHVPTINKNEVMNLKESKEGYVGKFGGRKGNGTMI